MAEYFLRKPKTHGGGFPNPLFQSIGVVCPNVFEFSLFNFIRDPVLRAMPVQSRDRYESRLTNIVVSSGLYLFVMLPNAVVVVAFGFAFDISVASQLPACDPFRHI